jgi:hypothetical protein
MMSPLTSFPWCEKYVEPSGFLRNIGTSDRTMTSVHVDLASSLGEGHRKPSAAGESCLCK